MGELIFVGVILAFSIVALIMVGAIREPMGSSNVIGARVVPYAVCALLLVTSAAAIVAVLRGDVGRPDEGEDIDAEARTSWLTVLLLSLSFASLIVVIPLAGWPVAVTVLFTGASLALGAASWWKALLLPLTYTLDVTSAIIMFAGIYYGGMYGGSTTSILLNTPGESASIVTALEGNRMARAAARPPRSRRRRSAPSSPARSRPGCSPSRRRGSPTSPSR